MRDPVVNGIYSAHEFKRRIKRGGLGRIFKKQHPEVDKIYTALQGAEVFRNVPLQVSLAPLRSLRQVVCKSLYNPCSNKMLKGKEYQVVKALEAALDKYIGALAEQMVDLLGGQNKNQYLSDISMRMAQNVNMDAAKKMLFQRFVDNDDFTLNDSSQIGSARLEEPSPQLAKSMEHQPYHDSYDDYTLMNTNAYFKDWGQLVWAWKVEDGYRVDAKSE